MDTPWLLDFLTIVFLVCCSAFFSSSETGLTTVSRARIFYMAETNKRAKIVMRLRERKEDLISTILLGNTLVNIASASIATSFAIKLFGDAAVIYVTVIMTVIILLFGEIIPKTFALQNSERFSLLVAWPVNALMTLFSPVNAAIRWFTIAFLKCFGLSASLNPLVTSSEVIRGTIELHHQEGGMVKHERDMLGSILDLGDIEVAQVMIHRNQVDMIDASLPALEIIEAVTHSSHSRLPFWHDNPDNIIGVLHVKDLYRLLQRKQGSEMHSDEILAQLSKPWFIPETTPLREQLFAFRQRKYHIAMVVDEYGAFLGVVTLEDIIEEIVGDIHDEHDRKPYAVIKQQPDGTYILPGTMTIRDLNRHLDWDLPDEEEFSTLAGLVIHEARAIPEQGAMFSFHGHEFIVIERKDNQIVRLKVRKTEGFEGDAI